MQMRITFNHDDIVGIARGEFERRFGKVPDGHDLSAHISYSELVLDVFEKPEPVPASDLPLAELASV